VTRSVAVAVVLLITRVAVADVPPGITQRVVSFITSGCDYFHAEPNRPRPMDDKKHAAHFGSIISAKRDGLPMRYSLKVPAFPGWEVSFWHDAVELKLPPTVAIVMGDLQHYFGPDSSLDVMYAVSRTSGSAEAARTEEREFAPLADHPVCRVRVVTERDAKRSAARRVFAITFAD
jgi:hypothetical protein